MSSADIVATLLALLLVQVSFLMGVKRGGNVGGASLVVAVGSHLVLAALSALDIILPLSLDNLAFYNQALDYTSGYEIAGWSGPSSRIWSYALSRVYLPFGPSVWLGYVVNLWIYLAAMIQLLRFAEEIGAGRWRWKIILIVSLLPSSLLYCNFLLRESFQLLMLLIAIRHFELYRRTGSSKSILVATFAFIPFGAIHPGFFLFGPIAIAGAVIARALLSPRGRRFTANPALKFISILLGVAALASAVAALALFEDSRWLAQVVEGDIDVAETITKSGERGARTTLVWVPDSGVSGTVVSAPSLLVQFIFAPILPLMISAPADLVAAADTAARMVFLFFTFRQYRRSSTEGRRMILYLVGTYLVFCLMASLGTTTVGTAMRHHLKVFWIIIAIGAPALFSRASRRTRSQGIG